LPTPVKKHENSSGAHTTSIKAVQAFTAQPVRIAIDDQMRASEIIKLQNVLVGLGKFSAGNVNKSIDDQMLGAKITELQTAANLP